MKKNILTDEKREELIKAHKLEHEKRIADRYKVVLLADKGWPVEQIAEALFIHFDTVLQHQNEYRNNGSFTLKHKGSKPILTEEESTHLDTHLEEKIYTKVKDIRAYIRATFHKNISPTALRKWLEAHEFSYKKPILVPKNADPVVQQEFIDEYEALRKKTDSSDEVIIFGDGVHPTQQTQVKEGWIKRKKDKFIESTAARKRLNIMGSINLEDMQFSYTVHETINQEAVIKHFKMLEMVYNKATVINYIIDQAGYHTGKEVREYLKTSRIKVHYLPPRSPNLNPIERLWKVMHEFVSHNIVYADFKSFKRAIFDFFDKTMPTIMDVLLSRVTDNFKVIGLK